MPGGFDGDESLLTAAAFAVAQTFGLLDPARDAQAIVLMDAGLAGAADEDLVLAAPRGVPLPGFSNWAWIICQAVRAFRSTDWP